MGLDFNLDLGDVLGDVLKTGAQVGAAVAVGEVTKKQDAKAREAALKSVMGKDALKADTALARGGAVGAKPEATGWSAGKIAAAVGIGLLGIAVVAGVVYVVKKA